MAERTMLVCDTCGRPAAETVTIRSSRGNRQRDYCMQHLGELLAPSRVPKRGRRPGGGSSSTLAKKTGANEAVARKPRAKRASGKKSTTRRRKAANSKA